VPFNAPRVELPQESSTASNRKAHTGNHFKAQNAQNAGSVKYFEPAFCLTWQVKKTTLLDTSPTLVLRFLCLFAVKYFYIRACL
jgi:hypothetical protein